MFPDNISLGSGTFYIKDTPVTAKLPEITFPDDEIPQYVKSFHLTNPADAEAEFEAEIDIPMINKLAYDVDADLINNMSNSCTIMFSQPYQEQRRKHKKKRINKKWAKRYGYVTKYHKYRITEVSLCNDRESEFEYLGRGLEIVR